MLMRRLSAAPGFAFGVMLTVALVVGVNASAFAGWWALLYKPLAFAEAQRWTELRIDLTDIDFQVGLSPSLYAMVRKAGHSFDTAIGAPEIGQPVLDEAARPWRVQRITADFSDALGVAPARGVAFSSKAPQPNGLLLSDRIWRERFAGADTILGQSVRIGDSRYQVLGVMPPGFAWPDADVDAWTPWIASAAETLQDAEGAFGQFHVAARLAPGVNLVQAQQTLTQLLTESTNAFFASHPERVRAQVRPWRDRFAAGHVEGWLLVQLAAALLLLVAAANLSGLVLDRLWARRHDYAVRCALGARRRDLLQLVGAELSLPALFGMALGMALTPAAIRLWSARGMVPAALPTTVGGDLQTWAVGVVAALLVVLIAVGGAVATVSRLTADAVHQRVPLAGMGRAQKTVLILQIALTTALAGSSALLLRSADNLAVEARGFDPRGVALTQLELSPEAPADTMQRVQSALALLPGVEHVATANMPPFSGAEFVAAVDVPGAVQPVQTRAPMIGTGYFEALGMPLLAGRDFTAAERANGDAVIIDANFQRRWLGSAPVPGSSLRMVEGDGSVRSVNVVGVVAPVKHKALDEDAGDPLIYGPLKSASAGDFLITRSALDVDVLLDQVRRVVAADAPGARLTVNLALEDAIARTLQTQRALVESVTLFGIATLVLAALGLYALLNAAVARRHAEFGVRMAVGGTPGRIRRLVLRQGSQVVAAGVALGLLSGLAGSSLLASRLHRLSPADATAWTLTALVVAVVALLACWLPAQRATRVPPRVALTPM